MDTARHNRPLETKEMKQHMSFFASHQLIDEEGQLYPASIIKVCGNDSHALYESAFDYTERASVAWLGGTIILSHNEDAPVKQGETLGCYSKQIRTPEKKSEDNLCPVYAWHTPILDTTTPLPFTPKRITSHSILTTDI